MAERRMFSKTIVDSDLFLDMPLSAQALYFHFCMRADDDGFVNNPKKIQRMVGCSNDDVKLLLAKKFIIPFESGVCVIRHWRIHNYIQKDRHKGTIYKDEMAQLFVDENGAYSLSCGVPADCPEPLDFAEKARKPLTPARKKRLEAKKNSELPYSFEYKIRQAFTGHRCPICGCIMDFSNNTVSPTIQHNKPISLGGKHEIQNISVICRSCNSSIQNKRETPPYNTEEVRQIWESVGNGYTG